MTKTKPKKYKTRAAKRRAELRFQGLPLPPPRTVFLPPRAMVLLNAKEKRVYTEKYKWTIEMQCFKVDRTWPQVLEEYAEFPLAHLDRKLYINWGSIRDKLSINRDQLDDMEGEQDDRAAMLIKSTSALPMRQMAIKKNLFRNLLLWTRTRHATTAANESVRTSMMARLNGWMGNFWAWPT
ncbi:hypothetical protein BCON_0042g00390 [Botryotinia convoluta]|uniref:Uncharacterized protein n=1 Tax=Botryotinia convoluta TaxID=54673 RepID=A0A4Z1IDJ5_9HELO|nr:hypothetical protein BCON_0042g00390 [Botryotinia convoluta]